METIDAVIESAKGTAQKYDYDTQTGFFRFGKILPAGMVFPYDFGFIPDTKGEDGDPLDIMVISEFQSFPGCMITCRLIGAIKATQREPGKKAVAIRNDRFLAVPVRSVVFENVKNVNDLPARILKELQEFFVNYNKIAGKIFTPLAVVNAKSALKMITDNRAG